MPGSKPHITGTQHHLPYNSLSPVQFEELCLWLVQREGFERAEHLGAAGSEQGRDVVAWLDDEQWVFQCKRVQTFTKALAIREITKLREELTRRNIPVPKHYVFVASCLISAEIRDQVRQQFGEQFDLHFWAITELNEKVNRHQDIKEQFFQIGAEPPPIPHQIPSPPQDFVNRLGELKQLNREHTKGIRTFLIHCPGSFGKTTLAYAFARDLEQLYPDGQIKIDLLGTEQQPLSVIDALGYVIHAFDPAQTIPNNQAELEALYRSYLHDKQVLLLLDDARDNAQVEPLIPPQSCSCLIVTSRLYIALPGCEELALTPLTPADAIKSISSIDSEAENDQDDSAVAEPAIAVPPESVRGEDVKPVAPDRTSLIERIRKIDGHKIIGPIGPISLIGLIGVAIVIIYIIFKYAVIPAPPTTPEVPVGGTSTSTSTSTSIMSTETPTLTSTQPPLHTQTSTPTPTHTSLPTPTPTSTSTSTSTPAITPFPNNCFTIDTWEFRTGFSEPHPTQSASFPACYNAELWGFNATDGIRIGVDNTETEIRGVRYPLPAGDAHIWADITLTNVSRLLPSSVVDLIVGIGNDPWELENNKRYNWWFYFIRDWGAESISQCVLFDYTTRCEAQEAIANLPDLPLFTEDNPLSVQLDIRITNRRVEVVVLSPQEDGSLASTKITNFRPLGMDLAWWLWVGYRTQNGGSVDSLVELYLTTPTPTPTP